MDFLTYVDKLMAIPIVASLLTIMIFVINNWNNTDLEYKMTTNFGKMKIFLSRCVLASFILVSVLFFLLLLSTLQLAIVPATLIPPQIEGVNKLVTFLSYWFVSFFIAIIILTTMSIADWIMQPRLKFSLKLDFNGTEQKWFIKKRINTNTLLLFNAINHNQWVYYAILENTIVEAEKADFNFFQKKFLNTQQKRTVWKVILLILTIPLIILYMFFPNNHYLILGSLFSFVLFLSLSLSEEKYNP